MGEDAVIYEKSAHVSKDQTEMKSWFWLCYYFGAVGLDPDFAAENVGYFTSQTYAERKAPGSAARSRLCQLGQAVIF
jgi:hypothetical protein